MLNELRKFKILFVLLLSVLTGASAQAGFSPLGLSIIDPVQFPPDDFTVTGARLNLIWGQVQSVYGFDVGLGNVTTQSMNGIQVGALNLNRGTITAIGLQAGAIGNFNTNKANIYGVQAALGMNSNKAESVLVGLGVAAVNNTPFTKVVGAQVGLYNKAGNVYGFQIGIVNSAEYLHGIQIGLMNFNNHGLFSVSPFLNAGF